MRGAVMILGSAAMFGLAVGSGLSSRRPPAPPPATVADDWQSPHASSGTVVIPRGWQGHFFTDGDVAGKSLNFLVDTGATTVALSKAQARSVGVDTDQLTYDRQMQTASGTVTAAAVTLPRLRIGDIQLLNVQATVLDTPNDIALLGESFLGRIDQVSISGDRMTLTKL
ncbi:retropepsin-like aspartic protease family protein [Sphingomonas abietis]|uniref:TIGR02281 family clan AA aspartic protease n=1 Tax=Sphingomonas abietis TaxID=3012344 RepID=A0ABY7NNB6_9SPHN|nr:TIGR02281 family clan AA aspartic protease [Sphingomonas abietis]WBO23029.1 TIGR02281 family clan AA aspartic protease [Sphingomonas abietis]